MEMGVAMVFFNGFSARFSVKLCSELNISYIKLHFRKYPESLTAIGEKTGNVEEGSHQIHWKTTKIAKNTVENSIFKNQNSQSPKPIVCQN